MDITNISTVNDLVEANAETTPLEVAMKAMEDVDYKGSRVMVEWLLTNMRTSHREMAVECFKNDDSNALPLADDAGKFDAILDILENIT